MSKLRLINLVTIISISTLISAYLPSLLIYVFGFLLILLSITKSSSLKVEYLFFYCAIFYCIGLLVYLLSIPSMMVFSDDYSSYYNNYMTFLGGNYLVGLFEYKFEVLLPILNFIASVIFNGEYPYLLKLYHGVINLICLAGLLFFIKKERKLSTVNFLFLVSCVLIFFKLPQQLHLMRQGYACYFVLMAIFTQSKNKTILFIVVGSLFHLSTPVVYLVLRAMHKIDSMKKVTLYSSILFTISFLLYTLSKTGVFFHLPVLNKLNYVLSYLSSDTHVKNSISETLKALIYFYPLLLVSVIRLYSGKGNRECYFILISFVFLFAFSYFPGLSIRVYMPFLSVLLGYLFYSVLYDSSSVFRGGVILVFLLFLNLNWVFKSELFYYRYPMIDSKPFYYVDDWFETKGEICRTCLPSDYEFKNPYR